MQYSLVRLGSHCLLNLVRICRGLTISSVYDALFSTEKVRLFCVLDSTLLRTSNVQLM